MRFIAIDPGEVWCGMATFEYQPPKDPYDRSRHGTGFICADSRVLQVPSRGMVKTVTEALWSLPATVVCEDYQVRPVGHARFSKGETLRLIGALHMYSSQSRNSPFQLIPPGDAEKELPLLSCGFLEPWMVDWPRAKHERWNHARSAWRVLLRYMMGAQPELLRMAHSAKVQATHQLMKPVYPLEHKHTDDLLAPGARWQVPRAICLAQHETKTGPLRRRR